MTKKKKKKKKKNDEEEEDEEEERFWGFLQLVYDKKDDKEERPQCMIITSPFVSYS